MRTWADMEHLLSEERTLLFEGRLKELPALAERKVSLLASLPHKSIPRDILRLATENAGLLEAAGRGIRAALDRIEATRTALDTRTYDAHGRVSTMPTAGRLGGRRA